MLAALSFAGSVGAEATVLSRMLKNVVVSFRPLSVTAS